MFNLNNFVVIGISHEELTLQEREAFIKTKPKNIIEKLYLEKKINGYINLSTCLRVEFYLELNKNMSIEEIKNIFSLNKMVIKKADVAIRYLFEVSCGFYSIIKGEDQILAQIKTAYSDALEEKHSTKIMNIIFNKAIELGKKFRTNSLVAHNALSIEAISLKFIKSKFSSLDDKNIFILGVGDLAQSILMLLEKEKLKNIYITNRTFHTAEKIKQKFININLVDFKEKYKGLANADIIISITSAPHIVVEYDKFIETMQKNKKYFFLDLAVPRDVDERLTLFENIDIFNLDDIWNIYNENSLNRDKLLKEFYYLIDEQIEKLNKALSYYEKEVI